MLDPSTWAGRRDRLVVNQVAFAIDLAGLGRELDAQRIVWRPIDEGERPLYAVDGISPSAVCWPRTYQDAANALTVANRLRLAVSPRGSGSKGGLGNRPRACDLVLSTEWLDRVVEYAPANLTVTVQAGMRLADLQTILGQHDQYLPLDPPFGATATLGGILATNSAGPRRLGFGTSRDLVIGTRMATTSGMVVRSGGRVVKNVAGYDLNKLYIGSLGTLGVIVEVGLKVAPRPNAQTTVIGCFARVDQVGEVTRLLRRSPLMPIAAELLDDSAVKLMSIPELPDPNGGYLLAVLGAAPGAAVGRQTSAFAQLFHDSGASNVTTVESSRCNDFWDHIADWPYRDPVRSGLRLKLAVPPGRVSDAVKLAGQQRDELGDRVAIGARAGSGIVYVIAEAPVSPDPPAIDRLIKGLIVMRQSCLELHGSFVIELCPGFVKDRIDVWGNVGSSFPIMRKLKDALDPHGILNPGRFVGGI